LIVGVHGIAQQFKGENTLHSEWFPPLRDGLLRNGVTLEQDSDFAWPFFGLYFREEGARAAGEIPDYRADDVQGDDEEKLLAAWWREAAKVEDGKVPNPDDAAGYRGTPGFVQSALRGLSYSKFFASAGEYFEEWIVADLKQVTSYFCDQTMREKIRAAVVASVKDDTRVLIGHSLGSVVAYECLCAHPEWQVQTLVTLGSPLGIPNLVFDRLIPAPGRGKGAWPGPVKNWINISDRGDVVALVKELAPRFQGRVQDVPISNGADAHNIMPYLTAKETGDAIASGLR